MYKHSLHAMSAWCVQLMGIKEWVSSRLIFAGLHCSCFQLLLVCLVLSVSERHSQYSCCCTVFQVTLHLYCTAQSNSFAFLSVTCPCYYTASTSYVGLSIATSWDLTLAESHVWCRPVWDLCVCVCMSEEALSVETLSCLSLLSTSVYNQWHTSFILKAK